MRRRPLSTLPGITRASTDIVKQAISATRGQVLTSDGKICDARFSKCCGGAFEEFQYCWEDIKYPYLAQQRDSKTHATLPDLTQEVEADRWIRTSPEAFCNTTDKKILSQVLNNYDQETTDFYRWKVEYTRKSFQPHSETFGHRLRTNHRSYSHSPRNQRTSLETEDCGNQAHAHHRQGAGNSPYALYFTPLQLCLRGRQRGVVRRRHSRTLHLTGAGWGHGVGLCQIGAAVMGEQGYKYDAILLHYYIGASIDKLYE